MRRYLLLAVLVLLPLGGVAQETSEENPVNERAFWVQKEIAILPASERGMDYGLQYSCQAVRLDEQWFLTAAHCVYGACDGTKACDVEIVLAEAELKAVARVSHNAMDQRVFKYSGFRPGQNRISGLDMALIKMDKAASEFAYAKPASDGGWVRISEQEFNRLLRNAPKTRAQMQAMNPLFISTVDVPTAQLKAQLVVPKVEDGKLQYLVGPKNGVYYVGQLEHFVSPDFGVRKGNSGGGVFTTSGALVGIVSARVYNQDGSATFYDEESKTSLTLDNAADYFLFASFNGKTLNFINSGRQNVRTVEALINGYVVPVPEEQRNFKKVTNLINRASLAL